MAEEEGFEPPSPISQASRFQGGPVQPLRHSSANHYRGKRGGMRVGSGVAALICSLSVTDIQSTNEGRVVDVARNMVASGEFWVPTLNGVPRLEKSPLVYWIVAASGEIWGEVNEFSARLPSVIVGLGCVLVTILIGRSMFSSTVVMPNAISPRGAGLAVFSMMLVTAGVLLDAMRQNLKCLFINLCCLFKVRMRMDLVWAGKVFYMRCR